MIIIEIRIKVEKYIRIKSVTIFPHFSALKLCMCVCARLSLFGCFFFHYHHIFLSFRNNKVKRRVIKDFEKYSKGMRQETKDNNHNSSNTQRKKNQISLVSILFSLLRPAVQKQTRTKYDHSTDTTKKIHKTPLLLVKILKRKKSNRCAMIKSNEKNERKMNCKKDRNCCIVTKFNDFLCVMQVYTVRYSLSLTLFPSRLFLSSICFVY